jgi:hypothetical protein
MKCGESGREQIQPRSSRLESLDSQPVTLMGRVGSNPTPGAKIKAYFPKISTLCSYLCRLRPKHNYCARMLRGLGPTHVFTGKICRVMLGESLKLSRAIIIIIRCEQAEELATVFRLKIFCVAFTRDLSSLSGSWFSLQISFLHASKIFLEENLYYAII